MCQLDQQSKQSKTGGGKGSWLPRNECLQQVNLARTTTAKRLHVLSFLFSVSNVQFQFPFPISISFPFPAFPYGVFWAAGPRQLFDCVGKYIDGSMNLLSDITLNPQVVGTSLVYTKLTSDLCLCVNGWIPGKVITIFGRPGQCQVYNYMCLVTKDMKYWFCNSLRLKFASCTCYMFCCLHAGNLSKVSFMIYLSS